MILANGTVSLKSAMIGGSRPGEDPLKGIHGVPAPDEGVALAAVCASCGGSLAQRGPKGGCLRCLLGVAFSFGDEPSPDATLAGNSSEPRRSQYGHFVVVSDQDGLPVELGAGAMATTYRAHDTVLHSAVALKVIHKSVAQRPATRERFLREARAAAKLRHPNIAGVSHYGEQEGECYYVMELIEGETLEARVQREGPLSPTLALEVGLQVARALSAAEACGVVHRDLKPSNLMLTTGHGQGDGHDDPFTVKVIDWGLAKAVGTDTALGADHTRCGFIGTPAFASPEQFATGEDRRVDTRSDIYSLGVTLWHLLCGRPPFVGGTLDAIHAQQRVPPLERLTAVGTPKPVVNLLRSMLALDPAARPPSARELLDQLRVCKQQVAAAETKTKRRAIHRWLAIVSATLVVLGVGAKVRWYHPRAGLVALDRSIAVLPFEKLGPNEADALFTAGLQDEVARNLARVATLRVVSQSNTSGGSLQDQDFPRICQELGVTHLLTGSVRRQDGQVLVEVRLFDGRDRHHVWSARYDRKPTGALLLPGEITRSVAPRLQAELSDSEKAAVAEPPTSDPEAFDLYLRVHYGQPFFQSENEKDRYLLEIGVPSLEAAVARDPNFVLAYCDLAHTHDSLAEPEVVTTPAETQAKHRRQAEAALIAARRLRPDGGEVHFALARRFYEVSRHREEARIELDLALRKLPESAEVEALAGVIAYNQNRWDDAVRHYERAAVLDPRNNDVGSHLFLLYRSLRRYDDADRVCARMIARLSPKDGVSLRLNCAMGSLEARADLAPLRAALRAVTPSEQPQVEVMDRFGLVLALCAHDPEAVSSLLANTPQTSFRIRGIVYPKAWFTALTARLRHDEAGARAAFALARNEVDLAVQRDPLNGRILGLLAMIDAGLGHREEAVREACHACELSTVETEGDYAPVVACNLAVVYAWTGQSDAACAVLEEWLQRPAGYSLPAQPTYGDLRLNPLWNPLRGSVRFEALLARLAPPGTAQVR